MTTHDEREPPELAPTRGPDRRRRPTRPWDVITTPGRRRWNRRAADADRHAVVDRHGPLMRTLVVAMLLLTILDGLLTLLLVDSHHDEANPLMAQLLARGALWFIFGKFALTAVCVPPLVIWKNHRLFGTCFRVKYLIPVIVGLYLVLTSVQVWFVGGPYGPRGLTAALAGSSLSPRGIAP